MALKAPPPPWELLQQVSELVGASGVKSDVDKSLRALAQSTLSRLDMVSREEFDAQTEILQRTRKCNSCNSWGKFQLEKSLNLSD